MHCNRRGKFTGSNLVDKLVDQGHEVIVVDNFATGHPNNVNKRVRKVFMKSLAIIGYGYVGKAMTKFFSKHYNVMIYDTMYDESHGTQFGVNFVDIETASRCDLAVVCVPTPSSDSGRCTTDIVEEVVDQLQNPLIIIKSTVEPGTTDRLKQKTGKRIVFAPEYCGESSYWSPYLWDREVKETPFFIFGGDPKDTSEAVDYYFPITGPVKTYRQTTAKSAEMAKYIENSFYATKITFAYEMACICKAAGLDYNEVRELWLLDPRINPMHTAVFAQNDSPFGGNCLPKDITALASWAEEVLGYSPDLLWEVLESNKRIGQHRRSQR